MWKPFKKLSAWRTVIALSMCGCSSGEERQWSPKAFANDDLAKALATAAVSGDVANIDALVASGADVNAIGKEGITPLMLALVRKNKAGYERLLKHGADPNHQSPHDLEESAPLFCAIYVHDVEGVRALLAAGADLNMPNGGGETPTEYAAVRHRWDIVNILLEAGADYTASLPYGNYTVGQYILIMPREVVESHPDQVPWYEKAVSFLKEKGV